MYIRFTISSLSNLICLLACISLFTNCTKEPERIFEVTCPERTTIYIPNDLVLSSSLNIPTPTVVTNCNNGEYSISSDIPYAVGPWRYLISYTISTGCGDQYFCSFWINLVLDQSAITIECPNTVYLEINSPEIELATLDLPDPVISSGCSNQSFEVDIHGPSIITPGDHEITYIVSNHCGALDSCTFKLTFVHDPSALNVDCPSNLFVLLDGPEVELDSITLPQPIITSGCIDQVFEIIVHGPNLITPGEHEIEYVVKDNCGGESACTFQLSASEDYRFSFIGYYLGNQHVTSYNGPPTYDTTITVVITLGNHANTVIVDGKDEVRIDPNGVFPYPSCCGYRWYSQEFYSDSLHIYKQDGSINHHTNYSFYGKKL